MNIIGVIPARYQSSRFPGKPLALINGKPMIWWVYRQVKKVQMLDDIYVATDSELICHACNEEGIPVIMTSHKHQTGTDRLGEVAAHIQADFYINIQGDEPLIEPETVEKVVLHVLHCPETEIVNTMTLLDEREDACNHTIVKAAAAENGDLLYLSRSPIPCSKNGDKVIYYKHLGLYGISRDALLYFAGAERTYLERIEDIEMLRFLENGYKIKILKAESAAIGVDRPEDIKKVEQAMAQLGIKP